MLGWLESTAPGNIAIECAIWYHDVIYDPRSARNEILSAEYFRAGIGVHLEPALVSEVSRLILATDHRSHRSYSHDESLLIDIDLSILGGDTELYDEYSKAIRLEYSHVPDDAYCEGRSAVLTGFLENTIFTTLPFLKLEANARNNILREVAALKQQKANKALHPTAGNAPVLIRASISAVDELDVRFEVTTVINSIVMNIVIAQFTRVNASERLD